MRFEIGDRVRVVENDLYPWLEGKTATVVILFDNICNSCGVRFDFPFPEGHDLDGRCEDGCGWYLPLRFLERYSNNKEEDLLKIFERSENCGSV